MLKFWVQSLLAWLLLLTATFVIFVLVGVIGYSTTKRADGFDAVLILAVVAATGFLIAVVLRLERLAQRRSDGPKARVTGSVVIDRPCSHVFAFVTDATNDTRWNAGLIQVLTVSAAPPAVGAKYSEVYRVFGRTRVAHFEIAAYEPFSYFVVRGKVGFRQVTASSTFTSINDSTLLKTSTEWPTSIINFPLNPLNNIFVKLQTQAQLGQLKRVLESEPSSLV